MTKIGISKALHQHGVDMIEIVIPPEDWDEEVTSHKHDDEAQVINVHVNWMLSNWECIFGRGCAGKFGVQDSTYPDDAGCCTDSFYFLDKNEIDLVADQMAQLTDEDWDEENRAYVEKNGFANIINNGEKGGVFNAKGKVWQGACVFQNRADHKRGKPGCAFHFLAERTGQGHEDTMPDVCWSLPLRFRTLRDDTHELVPWDISEWGGGEFRHDDRRYSCAWWCVDSPEAYIGAEPVYKSLETAIRRTVGDRAYERIAAALEARIAAGNVYAPMPGAVVNEGRPLLPLIIGNRTPARLPSPMPELLERMKSDVG